MRNVFIFTSIISLGACTVPTSQENSGGKNGLSTHASSQQLGRTTGASGFDWRKIFNFNRNTDGASNNKTRGLVPPDRVTLSLRGQDPRWQGEWKPEYSEHVKSELDKHPALLGQLGGNPMGPLCPAFDTFSVEKKKEVFAEVLASLSWAETWYNSTRYKGDEKNNYNLAKGLMQISLDARNFGCWRKGESQSNSKDSISCALRIMDSQFQNKGLPIVNSQTHWSVMRPGFKTTYKGRPVIHPMERRMMPTFSTLAPECNSQIQPELVKGHRPPPLITETPNGAYI